MRTGFTLIELVVVVSISIILAGFALSYAGTAREQTALYVEEAKIGQSILKAKALTLAMRGRTDLRDPCGYGVHFNYDGSGATDGTFFIFKYSATGTYTQGPNAGKPRKCDTTLLSGSNLPQGCTDLLSSCNPDFTELQDSSTTISADTPNVKLANPASSPRALNTVFFVAPDPTTYMWREGDALLSPLQNGSANIYLQTVDGNFTATVTVNQFGQVNF